MLRAAVLAEIIQSDRFCLILPTWVGLAAFDIDRLGYVFGTIELRIRFCLLLDGGDAINCKPVAKPLEIVSEFTYMLPLHLPVED